MESTSPTVFTSPRMTVVGRNGSSNGVSEALPAEASSTAPTSRQPVKPPVGGIERPPERRLSAATLAGFAAAAGVAAIVLGGWAFMSGAGMSGAGAAGVGTDRAGESGATAAPTGFEEALALLAKPNAERLQLQGSVGRIILVVQPSNDAALVLNGLGEADSEWAYQVWVTPRDSTRPRPAGLFWGREVVVPLTSSVPPGALVAVTLEPATGSFAPTRQPKLLVERPA